MQHQLQVQLLLSSRGLLSREKDEAVAPRDPERGLLRESPRRYWRQDISMMQSGMLHFSATRPHRRSVSVRKMKIFHTFIALLAGSRSVADAVTAPSLSLGQIFLGTPKQDGGTEGASPSTSEVAQEAADTWDDEAGNSLALESASSRERRTSHLQELFREDSAQTVQHGLAMNILNRMDESAAPHPDVSPTLINVIFLACQYFIVYAAFHIVHSYNQLRKKAGENEDGLDDTILLGEQGPLTGSTRASTNIRTGARRRPEDSDDAEEGIGERTLLSTLPDATQLEKILLRCVQTVQLCPMLAILFIATRLRAGSLSPDPNNILSPPGYAQTCMYICTYAVLADTVLTATLPIFLTDVNAFDDLGDADGGGAMLGGGGGMAGAGGGGNNPQNTVLPPPQQTWFQRMKDRVEDTIEDVTGIDIDGDGDVGELGYNAGSESGSGGGALGTRMFGAVGGFGAATGMNKKRGRGPSRAEKREIAYNKKLRALRAVKMISITRTLLTVFGVYLGFSIVVFALISMEAPPGNRHCPTCAWSWTPDVPASIQCLINLTLQYFLVYLTLYVAQMYTMLGGNNREPLKVVPYLERAREASELCPILSVLFIAVRLRANQLKTEPQSWAKDAFYVTTYSILGQTVVSLLQPLLMHFSKLTALISEFARYVCLAGIYLGTLVCIASIFSLKLPKHFDPTGANTPAVSTAGKNILIVIILYFTLFLMLQIIRSYSTLYLGRRLLASTLSAGANGGAANNGVGVDHSGSSNANGGGNGFGSGGGGAPMKTNLEIMLEEGLPSLELIPMLGVVFVLARFRALEVHSVSGEVQSWAKIFMYAASIGVVVQTVCCVLLPYFANQQIVMMRLAGGGYSPAGDRTQAMKTTKEKVLLNYRIQAAAEKAKQLTFTKIVAMGTIYVSIGAVMTSIITI